MQRYIIFVALMCALITFSSSSPALSNTGPMLNLLTTTANEIEGEYYSDMTDESHAIHFRSVTHNDNDDSYLIQITTIDEKPLYTIKAGSRSSKSFSVVYILGTQLVITNYSNGSIADVAHYHVPKDYQKEVDKTIASDSNSFESLTKLLHGKKRVKKPHMKLSIMPALLRRPEIGLMRDAALALENSRTEESETIAAMTFYELSLQLKIARARLLKKAKPQASESSQPDKNRLNKRQLTVTTPPLVTGSGNGDGSDRSDDDYDYDYDDYYDYYDYYDSYYGGTCDLVEVCVAWDWELVCC